MKQCNTCGKLMDSHSRDDECHACRAERDALAVSIFKQQGFILGFAIADLVRVFDPGLVVIGGGLAETSFRDQYMQWIEEGFADRAWPVYRYSPLDSTKQTTRFEWALGGDAAAAIGMAYTARELFQSGGA